ncbi:MAG: GNAT family N-acetyltransferase [Limisphaerales bacterium]
MEQTGFARVITDSATMAYIADVFAVPAHRGRGLAKQLAQAILGRSELQNLAIGAGRRPSRHIRWPHALL